ncbi:hypothetical protein IFM89_005309 [Coptis chinensis]|uniref:Uncharacterized protein n=1 Tax=Coptis chinensis TaxID=261450 RepID=A0A835LHK1_9MAGN|nr:hypothetical protein IFM89_005309 [Coptis chinensis]
MSLRSPDSHRLLANQYLLFGKVLLSTKNPNSNAAASITEALKLMNEALDLCDKGLRVAKRQDETLAIKNVKSKTLRFMAAAHLQAGRRV